jgi:hypothetical protein
VVLFCPQDFCAGLVLARAHHYPLCCWSNVLLVLVPLEL